MLKLVNLHEAIIVLGASEENRRATRLGPVDRPRRGLRTSTAIARLRKEFRSGSLRVPGLVTALARLKNKIPPLTTDETAPNRAPYRPPTGPYKKPDIAGVGVLTAQPEVVGAGLTVASVGGTGNITAGAMQFGAGIFQGIGGGGFSNSGYALLSLGTGIGLARGIVGSAASGYRTVSQRAADAFANGGATIAGGVNDLAGSLVDAAAPQQAICPGGN